MRWYPSTHLLLLLVYLFLFSSSTLIGFATSEIGSNAHKNIRCIEEEREALLRFKQGIQDYPDGALASWTGEECCHWQGILCNNQSGHVVNLDLRSCNLKGRVNPSLVELKHLIYLDLSNNDFQGQSIPSFIASIHTLESLFLSNANFEAEIPPQLANLSSLTSLDLSDNYYCYSSSLRWLSRLTLLRDINLRSINLSQAIDWIQSVNNLPSLESLQLDYCSLASTIPRSPLSYANSSTTLRVLSLSNNVLNGSSVLSWVANLTTKSANHLEYLDLSRNEIQGPIPSAFGNLPFISYLSLKYNNLEGPIPSSFVNISSISHLYLSSNKLEGLIPRSIFGLKLLEDLCLDSNNFQGIEALNSRGHLCSLQEMSLAMNNITSDFSSIIEAFSRCANKSLVSLDVSYNRLRGSIPDTIGSFSSLETLSLGANQLDGAISPSLGQLSKLQNLDLSNNSFRGPISEHHFANLSSLGMLALYDNFELVVNISSTWVPPFQLGLIFLRSCNLGPYFPKWLLTQKSYIIFDVSNSGIHDSIPVSFWKSLSPNLWQLNMSHNEIFGVIPDLPITCHIVLDLSSNNIEGVIPSFFGDATVLLINNNKFSGSTNPLCSRTKENLQILDLSNNFLSEQLPDCWADTGPLSILRLDNNNFTGELPSSLVTLNQLIFLSLRNNRFSGELQIPFKNWTSLVILDLGYNSFTGSIPEEIGNLKNIQILDFQRNNISGRLPSSLCQLTSLQIMDFSFNHISGTIPGCICNLLAMANSTNNISYTRGGVLFADTVYYAITQTVRWKTKDRSFSTNLGLVRSIAISDNNLEGQIPRGISCLKCLTSLDLARNNLTGPIPSNIGDMGYLEFLDLSQNHLSGEIPSSLGGLSFLGVLDLSYNNLSGIIPTGTQLRGMNSTAYAGNPGLCGPPLAECVRGDRAPNTPKGGNSKPKEEKDDDNILFPGLCISILLGFIGGFWGVCGTLVIKRSWRHAYFQYVEHIYDKFYAMLVTIPRIWRKT